VSRMMAHREAFMNIVQIYMSLNVSLH